MKIIGQKSNNELSALGFKFIASSFAFRQGECLVQSFIAKYKGLKVHGWFSKGVYEISIIR